MGRLVVKGRSRPKEKLKGELEWAGQGAWYCDKESGAVRLGLAGQRCWD